VAQVIVDAIWAGMLIASAFLAGRASHDAASSPADLTVRGSLDLLVDEELLSRDDYDELWRQYVQKVRSV
jgi:hypothetical protein